VTRDELESLKQAIAARVAIPRHSTINKVEIET